MTNELAALRAKVSRLASSVRTEKREKGSHWQNEQCKDWLTYNAERSRLHSMEKELGLR
jgi:hypothetical protein